MEKKWLASPPCHLTEDERASFETFVQRCSDQKLLQRPLGLQEDDLNHGLIDRDTLLRFLRGRSYDVDRALKQFKDALTIQQSGGTISGYEDIDIDEFEGARNIYPHWSGSRDKTGMPICIFDLARLDNSSLTRYRESRTGSTSAGNIKVTNATRQAMIFNDYLTRFVLPICSAMTDREDADVAITSAVYLVDASSFTFKQAWNMKSYVQDVGKLLATSYPEVIDRIYILNAPSYFGLIWSFLSKWLDPRTASKLVGVPPALVLATLAKTIDIHQIPTQFGGQFSFQHGMPPKVDKGILQSLTWSSTSRDQLPAGPIKLAANKRGQKILVAVGTTDAERRREILGSTTLSQGHEVLGNEEEHLMSERISGAILNNNLEGPDHVLAQG